jgi:hypothetical protein
MHERLAFVPTQYVSILHNILKRNEVVPGIIYSWCQPFEYDVRLGLRTLLLMWDYLHLIDSSAWKTLRGMCSVVPTNAEVRDVDVLCNWLRAP